MATQKWNAVDFLCNAIRYVGNFDTIHAGVCEALHQRFKAPYCCFSRRKQSDMDEVIVLQNDDMIHNKSIFVAVQTEVEKTDPVVAESSNFDTKISVRSDAELSFSNIERLK